MKKYTALLFSFFIFVNLFAQQCQYLCYEGFNYLNNEPLHGAYGGTGWNSPWEVQNGNIQLPGYGSLNLAEMSYQNLLLSGGVGTGGKNYLSAGRKFDLSENGPFSGHISSNGKIGATGSELFGSFLLQKTSNNNSRLEAVLQGASDVAWFNNSNPKLQLGFIGDAGVVNGIRYWGMSLNGQVLLSNIPVVVNETVLIVYRISFGESEDVVDVWINPSDIAGSSPESDLQLTTNSLEITSFALNLGSDANYGRIDEIRLGTTFRCVTPDYNTDVNTPPNAVITSSADSVSLNSAINFSANMSSDLDGPLASEYEWIFGDGNRDTTSSPEVNHIYSDLGEFVVSLKVMDSGGLTHTAYHHVLVTDGNGHFPCQGYAKAINKATCNGTDGSFRVFPVGANFYLKDSNDNLVNTLIGGDVYNELSAGDYKLFFESISGCRDTLNLNIAVDSTTCADWQPKQCLNIGINPDGISYYDKQRIFKNYVQTSGNWITYNATAGGPWDTQVVSELETDMNGFPIQIPFQSSLGLQKVRLMLSALGHMSPGDYVIKYNGQGSIAVFGVTNVLYQPGRITFEVAPGNQGNIWLDLNSSVLGDHVRDLVVSKLEYEFDDFQANPFYEGFLQKLMPFSTVRFMDLLSTNNYNEVVNWGDRKSPNRYTQAGKNGLSYEYVIAIGNKTRKNIWINIPHTATDEYITQMARLFRDSFDSDLKIYLEYSNEVWNWMFSQAHEVSENGPQNIVYPRRYAERAKHAFQIWMKEFIGQEGRVLRVLNTQYGNSWYTTNVLAHLNNSDYDFISPAWYFSYVGAPCSQSFSGSTTIEEIIECSATYFRQLSPSLKQDYLDASLFGTRVVNYEGGQHMTDFSMQPYTQAVWDAQVSEQMYHLYNEVIDSLKLWGSDLSIAYNLARVRETVYGSFGHLEDIDQIPSMESTPKWMAILDQNCNWQKMNKLNLNLVNSNVPAGIWFQGRIPNNENTGSMIDVELRVSIFNDQDLSQLDYQEVRNQSVNSMGLFSFVVGENAQVSHSNFSNIDWNSESKFLAVEMRVDGEWVPIGTQKLASLPMAFHARVTEKINGLSIPVFNSNSEALNAGLNVGQCYRNDDGTIKIVLPE